LGRGAPGADIATRCGVGEADRAHALLLTEPFRNKQGELIRISNVRKGFGAFCWAGMGASPQAGMYSRKMAQSLRSFASDSLHAARRMALKNAVKSESLLNGPGGRYVRKVVFFKRHDEKVPVPVPDRNGPDSRAGADLGRPAYARPGWGTFFQHAQRSGATDNLRRSTGATFLLERTTSSVLWPAILRFATPRLPTALVIEIF